MDASTNQKGIQVAKHSYTIHQGIATLVYVNQGDENSRTPWKGTCVIYHADDRPLEYSGPFELPPYLQEKLRENFDHGSSGMARGMGR